MDKDKLKEMNIKEERNNLVVQSNSLIRNIKSIKQDLSVTEQKLIIFLISKICADDKDFKKVSVNLSQFVNICGIKKSGREFEQIKSSIKILSDKSWWIDDENGSQLFRWIDTSNISKYKTIELIFSESLKPYLLELNKNFTKYELINVLCLRSKYSIRLYEIFKSYLWLGKWEITLDEFKELLNIKDKYTNYKELKRRIINQSLKEINKFTDLNITVDEEKYGNKVYKLIFKITEKQGYQMVLDLIHTQDERLKIED